ncbi:MAG: HIT family protein [Streptococcus sp.]|nr:HIT family protein [Streptococcus sp.]
MSDCIFCKIIAGEIPSLKIYEDETVLAFLDISQVTPGHTLLIPKKHFRNFLEMDIESSNQLFSYLPNLAQKIMKATNATGMNILNNNEEIAGQTVFHTHIHLIPRYSQEDDLKITFTAHEPDFPSLTSLAEKISQA